MEELIGNVEAIIFKNEESGYVIAKLRLDDSTIETIVGVIPYIIEGQRIKLKGKWIKHQKFGDQLKVEFCEEVTPDTIIGIEKYLSSGIIAGIGPVTAKKIVEHFKEKTLDILDNNLERLSEIEGIGKKKIQVIYESYAKQREIRNVILFLQPYGMTPSQCVKIYNMYGLDGIEIIKNNPYKLVDDIDGVGFKTADKLALNLGIDKESSFRISTGITYVVNEFCLLGNTYMPMEKLVSSAMQTLLVSKELIEENVFKATLEGRVKVENIEEVECVFTLPYYYSELFVTKKIINLVTNKYANMDIDVDNEISIFEEEHSITLADSQKEAIIGACRNGIEIITGGPGTGKTTIINCITDIFEKRGFKVGMAAPTGRAAKRMQEATGREAKTIHRLLELGYGDDESDKMFFTKNEDDPLEFNLVIVDEASMIDIVLMNYLLKAISLGTRLIIVGDVDQLPSVGPGNVLRDIIDSKCAKVVRLSKIFRQGNESMIVVNAHMINEGEMPILNKKNSDFYFLKCEEQDKILSTIIGLINTRLPKFNGDWDKLKDIQVLSPTRKGNLGVDNLNRRLQEILNNNNDPARQKVYRDSLFKIGDKVMQTKNNYSIEWYEASGKTGKGIYNGDIGYVDHIDSFKNLVVKFEDDKYVKYENNSLDELTLAYAITIHKSQGSEFPVVVIPIFKGPPMLMNKNLIYTGVTRAKKLLVLVGSERALQYTVNNDRSFERYSSLKWRINDIMSLY